MKILLIDDDENIVDVIFNTFNISWPEAEIFKAYTGREGVKLAEQGCPEIILLDLGLPDITGFEAITRIRQVSQAPIIIITARGEEDSIVKALGMGADEYLTKPFGQLELLARIKAIARRTVQPEEDTFVFGRITLDCAKNRVHRKGDIICLTNTEKVLLKALMQRKGKMVNTRTLAAELYEAFPGEENIKTYIYRLRRKLEPDPGNPTLIMNDPGVGYYITG